MVCHYLVRRLVFSSLIFVGFPGGSIQRNLLIFFPEKFFGYCQLKGWMNKCFFEISSDKIWKPCLIRLIFSTSRGFCLSQTVFFGQFLTRIGNEYRADSRRIYMHLSTKWHKDYALTKIWNKEKVYWLEQKYVVWSLHWSSSALQAW